MTETAETPFDSTDMSDVEICFDGRDLAMRNVTSQDVMAVTVDPAAQTWWIEYLELNEEGETPHHFVTDRQRFPDDPSSALDLATVANEECEYREQISGLTKEVWFRLRVLPAGLRLWPAGLL